LVPVILANFSFSPCKNNNLWLCNFGFLHFWSLF